MSDPPAPPERLLCDTSFVGASAKRLARPGAFAQWPVETVHRIDAAILAISVITLAEARYGFLNADWGAARVEREERRLASFLHVPLDPTIVDEWARLRMLSKRNGWNVSDNDLWIAATATARGYPLVTCDGDQARITDASLEVVHLPAPQ